MSNGRDSVEMANLFLKLGVSADELLDVAAEWCSAATVAVILDAGADLNRMDDDGEVPLYRATKNKSTAVLKLLLERGADLTLLNEDGTHSLHFCALWGDLERLKILLDREFTRARLPTAARLRIAKEAKADGQSRGCVEQAGSQIGIVAFGVFCSNPYPHGNLDKGRRTGWRAWSRARG